MGLIVQLVTVSYCCGNPHPTPTLAMCILCGLIVTLIAVLICAAFAGITLRAPVQPMLLLAFCIGIPVGVLLGPLACHLPNPGLSLALCGILGAGIGWLVCLLLCRDTRWSAKP